MDARWQELAQQASLRMGEVVTLSHLRVAREMSWHVMADPAPDAFDILVAPPWHAVLAPMSPPQLHALAELWDVIGAPQAALAAMYAHLAQRFAQASMAARWEVDMPPGPLRARVEAWWAAQFGRDGLVTCVLMATAKVARPCLTERFSQDVAALHTISPTAGYTAQSRLARSALGLAHDMDAAVALGLVRRMQQAHASGEPFAATTCRDAAAYGHLTCLQYAHEHGASWSEDAYEAAAYHGHLDCLTYLHEHGCPRASVAVVAAAARRGHRDCLLFLVNRGCQLGPWLCAAAAAGGHLACLQLLRERGCPWDERTLYEASRGGHQAIVEYALRHGCPRGEERAAIDGAPTATS
jgi:hypothetical protein